MSKSTDRTVDYDNPTHFISKPTIGNGFGIFERKDGGNWTEVGGQLLFKSRAKLLEALDNEGYTFRKNAVWAPSTEQKALAEIRGIIGRMRWDAKPGYLLPEEAINLIRDILSREVRHG